MPNRSAVIAVIALPADLAAQRDGADRMAALGVPAHVTILFPFLHVGELAEPVRSTLAGIAADAAPFIARFAHVERHDGTVWLLPADQRPFLDLTRAVAAAWPDHPPYEGIHDELIAHLTLVESPDARALDAAQEAAVNTGPLEAQVDALTVIVEDERDRWHPRWHLPLGTDA